MWYDLSFNNQDFPYSSLPALPAGTTHYCWRIVRMWTFLSSEGTGVSGVLWQDIRDVGLWSHTHSGLSGCWGHLLSWMHPSHLNLVFTVICPQLHGDPLPAGPQTQGSTSLTSRQNLFLNKLKVVMVAVTKAPGKPREVRFVVFVMLFSLSTQVECRKTPVCSSPVWFGPMRLDAQAPS
jgi:hypothetical protein